LEKLFRLEGEEMKWILWVPAVFFLAGCASIGPGAGSG
jgi:hypothetical protein